MSSTIHWAIDPTHSEIGFKVKHMMFTNVSGKFEKYTGGLTTTGDSFDGASIEFTAEVASVSTGNADRDAHLVSADFFDAAQYPELKFVSTSFESLGGNDYVLKGDLSLHGVTKPVKLDVEFTGSGKDPWGNEKAAFTLVGKINRKEWGLAWNVSLDSGGVLVGEEIKLAIEVQLAKGA